VTINVFAPVFVSCSTLRLCARFSANDNTISGSAKTMLGNETVIFIEEFAETAGLAFPPLRCNSIVLVMKNTVTISYSKERVLSE
jgi:hypothetical protein